MATCDLDIHMSVQQQVLSLQVPVDDVPVVAELYCGQDLPELPSGLWLAQAPMAGKVVCRKAGGKGSKLKP